MFEGTGSEEEIRRKAEKPVCDAATAVALAEELYGLRADAATCKELESYDDRNFSMVGTLLGSSDRKKYLLKVHNGVESDNLEVLSAQNAIIMHLHKNGFSVPTPIATTAARIPKMRMAFRKLPLKDGSGMKRHAVRLLHWVAGKCLSDVECDAKLLYKAGYYLGNMSKALDGFDHPGSHRVHQWDLNQTKGLSNFVQCITDPARRQLVESVIAEWSADVEPGIAAGLMRTGMIQADFNDANIVLNQDETDISGVIDFGDTVNSLLVNDLAIAMAYSMVSTYGKKNHLAAAAAVYAGYVNHPASRLRAEERSALLTLVACRLSISYTLGMYSYAQDPGNEYLLFHAQPAWSALHMLRTTPREQIEALLEATAASPPSSDFAGKAIETASAMTERRNWGKVVFVAMVATAFIRGA